MARPLALGIAGGLLITRLPYLLGPPPLHVVAADGADAAAEWARWLQAERLGEWYAQLLWRRLLQATPQQFHAALRGVETAASPICSGDAIRQPDMSRLHFAVSELRATWRDGQGAWRRADGLPCLSPAGEPLVDPPAKGGPTPVPAQATEASTGDRAETSSTDEGGSADPTHGFQVIALYQVRDSLLPHPPAASPTTKATPIAPISCVGTRPTTTPHPPIPSQTTQPTPIAPVSCTDTGLTTNSSPRLQLLTHPTSLLMVQIFGARVTTRPPFLVSTTNPPHLPCPLSSSLTSNPAHLPSCSYRYAPLLVFNY